MYNKYILSPLTSLKYVTFKLTSPSDIMKDLPRKNKLYI